MRGFVKSLLYSIAPQWSAAFFSARSRAFSQNVIASWGNTGVVSTLKQKFGSTVQEGPFAGIMLAPMAEAEQFGPYLLGVYESQLDDAWATVLRGNYTQIIDVGAKFGYYAVALAKKYPNAIVIAFDTDAWARDAIREMAAANGTANVQVEGFCSAAWLERNIADGAFIISDCEGYEAELFREGSVARLKSATLIIETHDVFVAGVSARLRKLFSATHTVREFGGEGSRRETTRDLDFLSEQERGLATQEVRPAQIWLLCTPKTGSNASN